ncbi:hypothetical protein AXF42_Ash017451 [Apostasia shenzhenica]|uniref:N-alpha-acetyltransferase 40 n=1 Tax=Apostasia shenzhenica TaxID=1088818 RepID=A0A2H9ZZ49_9ASPA|nr:hypothetical protein AXF42_Ash017451 [Apostasia shenzhenica]
MLKIVQILVILLQLLKKKEVDELIKSASAVKNHLAFIPEFCQYDRNGLSVYFESKSGDQLSSYLRKYIRYLLKVNMENHYGSEWLTEEKVKRREMIAPEARYIIVRESSNAIFDDNAPKEDARTICWTGDGDRVVGFVHYRFVVEEDIPVVYVYELQLETFAQGRGLGKFLMQLVEFIAHKVGAEMSYELLCKTFDSEAKAKLEV